MKFLLPSILVMILSFPLNVIAQDPVSLPFFDDFEETILAEPVFTKWTTENLEGWHYWHIIPWSGNPGQCMRFENNDLAQNDWLISKPINIQDIEKLTVSFNNFHIGQGIKPRLLYTCDYTGNADLCQWTELTYTLGENEGEWYNSGDITITSTGSNTIWLAFHYQAAANEGVYLLLDNFRVKEYEFIAPFELTGSTAHFEFYTNISGESDYWLELRDRLETGYLNYKSLWERPSSNTVFPVGQKIKIKYTSRQEIPLFDSSTPAWDCGSFDFSSGEIYICNPESADQQAYYGNLASLAVNELAQMALKGWLDYEPERWYSEGFGLYEMGYRPDRIQLLQKLSDVGTQEPEINLLTDISQLYIAGNKDLMASLFQSKAVIHCYPYGHWGNSLYKWWQLLKHYYIKEEDRIILLYTTEHFDVYAAEKETPYVEALALNMEEQMSFQQNRFALTMDHRVNACIYDVEVGREINNRTDFQGLANPPNTINSVHLDIGDYGLVNHEFMHCWVNYMSPFSFAFIIYPGQFINEGLAESTDEFMTDEEFPTHRYKIQDLYYHYQRKYNREPTWLEIVDNAEVNAEDGFWVDAYAIGEMYWRYMNDKYPDNFWINVKLFLQNNRDWTVFGGLSTEQEGAEFIQFMKELAFVGPPLEARTIPFYENFRNEFNGWTLMRFGANDHWQINSNTGFDDTFSAFAIEPYWLEEKDVDSWLVSPPLAASGINTLNVRLKYLQTGQGIKPRIYYTGSYTGPTAATTWNPVEDIDWIAPEGEWGEIVFTIADPPQKLFIALRFLSNEGNIASYCIDNVSVKNLTTNIEHPALSASSLKIFPNPAEDKSIITFKTRSSGNVRLELLDAGGKKLFTILDSNIQPGTYTFPLNKYRLKNGLYIVTLSTRTDRTSIKLVVNR